MRSATLTLAGTALLTLTVTRADDAHTIDQIGRSFRPGVVTISRGDVLVFSNQDDFIHQIYVKSDAMSFDSNEQPPGENVSVSFPAVGTFAVRCHIHPRMNLTVIVK